MKWLLFLWFPLFWGISFADADSGSEKIHYDESGRRPYEPDRLGTRGGRFYVLLPKEGKIAVIDPQVRSVVKSSPIPPTRSFVTLIEGKRFEKIADVEVETGSGGVKWIPYE